MPDVPAAVIESSVRTALDEDVGSGDVTARLISEDETGNANLISRESMCLCGAAWFDEVFAQLDARVRVDWNFSDGDWVPAESVVCILAGPARALLTGERSAMNFLQMLSGTATTTRKFANCLQGSSTELLDTRKTIPGHRLAQKYAVRCGGGSNHRMGLYDAFLVKENHIAAAGGIAPAIARARAIAPEKPVEVEVETLAQLEEAISHGADIVMLDNFDNEALARAVRLNRETGGKRAKIEVSGNVDEARLAYLAQVGVDYVSVGALTKNIRAVDLSMRFLGAIKNKTDG